MQPESRSALSDKGFTVQRSFLTIADEGAMTCRTGTARSPERRWLV